MTLRLRNLQVDLPPEAHDAGLAWWADALGGTPRAVEGPYHHLDGVRAPVGVHVQRLDAGPARYHLDLETDDVAGEVDRLVGLGATLVGDAGDAEPAVVLADPAGTLLCVTRTGQGQHLREAEPTSVRLQVLMLDVPSAAVDATTAFWAAALGGRAEPVGERYPEYTWIHDVTGPGGPVAVAVQDIGPDGSARLHLDLHVAGPSARDAEVARLTAAGATVASTHAHWVVLASPGGLLCCVVPDRAQD